jgi:hypothetical protein
VKKARLACIALAISLFVRGAFAVDGISVTTHWSGVNALAYGGLGEIWRHDIQDSKVVGHTLLYSDDLLPGRGPVLSPDGTRVAFVRADGSIAIVSVDGGPPEILQQAQTTPRAFLDWPVSSWIYYAKGGMGQPTASRHLHRVNPVSGKDEFVLSFKKDDGTTDSGVWRVRVGADLRRALVRTDDRQPEPFGRIVALDLLEDNGVLRLDRATDRFSCSEGLSPDSELFIDGQMDHGGIDIRRWDDLSIVSSLRWSDTSNWGPSTGDLGSLHNLNNWSVNSADWMAIHLVFAELAEEVRAGNQVLVDWRNQNRIAVTHNADNSYEFDCAGDFFVTSEGGDVIPPSIVSVQAERNRERVLVSFSEPVEPGSATAAETYSIEPFVGVLGAALAAEDQVELTVEPLDENTPYVLRLEASILDRATPPNALPAGTEAQFQYYSGQGPLAVDAGQALKVTVGEPAFLTGSAKRGGLLVESAAFQWEIIDGPGPALVEKPDSSSTFATFEAVGVHAARLTVEHMGETASASVEIDVLPEPAISILSPRPGQNLHSGQLAFIDWTAEGVFDVTIYSSTDGQASFDMVALTVDTSSPYWGRFPWLVSSQASQNASLFLEEYSQVCSATADDLVILPALFELAVVAPEPLSRLRPGEQVAVLVEGASGPLRLELSLDGGRTYESVASLSPDSQGRVNFTWTAPRARTFWAILRATESGTGAVATSGVFSISPEPGDPASEPLESLRAAFSLPSIATPTDLRVDGDPVTEVFKDQIVVELPWPQGVSTYVFELRGQTSTAMFRRLITVSLD